MFVEVDGRRLWIDRRGLGPPLLLLPGGPGMAADYLAGLAEALDDRFTVISLDPCGSGRSEGDGGYTVRDHVSDIDVVRASLGYDGWIVGGHSFGADLALAYALERPDRVRAVVAISSTGVQDDRAWHAAYAAGRDTDRDQIPVSRFPIDRRVHAATLASWRRYIKQPDLYQRIAAISCPYLAISGVEDIRPYWPVAQVVAMIPAGRGIEIPGAGHCPWWTHATDLRSAVLALAD